MTTHARWIGQQWFIATWTQYTESQWIWIRFKHMQLLRFRCECKHFQQTLCKKNTIGTMFVTYPSRKFDVAERINVDTNQALRQCDPVAIVLPSLVNRSPVKMWAPWWSHPKWWLYSVDTAIGCLHPPAPSNCIETTFRCGRDRLRWKCAVPSPSTGPHCIFGNRCL